MRQRAISHWHWNAQTAAKFGDAKTIANHADAAKGHIKVIDEHLKAGVTSLDAAIEHAKQGHTNLAKKSAEEAVLHLNAAQ
ncbi:MULTISPECIES: small metal-binding protein SmbP [Methylomonas]|uniref:Small metal-binding protein n=1 Tax=Methylomonas methanica TaxID=421 RepID=A0ABY2CM48_METMH|nr:MULTISPECIES: small metal-binding protein SmbP [Methylomonas]TCV77421.1 small metal-binding protein [Methylomonas methanica]